MRAPEGTSLRALRRHSDGSGSREALQALAAPALSRALLLASLAQVSSSFSLLCALPFPLLPSDGGRRRGRPEAFHPRYHPELLWSGLGALGPAAAGPQSRNQQLLGRREPDGPPGAALRRRPVLF